MKNKILLLLLIVAMAAGLVLAGCSARTDGAAQGAVVGDNIYTANTITVNATGTIKVMPDVAYVTVGVKTQATSMTDAQQQNKTLMNSLIEALKEEGLTDDDIRTTSYSAYPMYDYTGERNTITGYEVTNLVELTINDIEAVGDYIDIAAEAGANTAYQIRFDLQDESGFYNEALAEALGKAKAKADALAEAGKYTIQGTLQISEGNASYSPYMTEYAMADTMAADGGGTPISAGELEVTATVTMVYEID